VRTNCLKGLSIKNLTGRFPTIEIQEAAAGAEGLTMIYPEPTSSF
jgi:hypothetical protein